MLRSGWGKWICEGDGAVQAEPPCSGKSVEYPSEWWGAQFVHECNHLVNLIRHTNLSLHLFASPFGNLRGARRVITIRACLFDHVHEPTLAEDLPEVSLREGISNITRQVRSFRETA